MISLMILILMMQEQQRVRQGPTSLAPTPKLSRKATIGLLAYLTVVAVLIVVATLALIQDITGL